LFTANICGQQLNCLFCGFRWSDKHKRKVIGRFHCLFITQCRWKLYLCRCIWWLNQIFQLFLLHSLGHLRCLIACWPTTVRMTWDKHMAPIKKWDNLWIVWGDRPKFSLSSRPPILLWNSYSFPHIIINATTNFRAF
jgi:hypothetical protein